MSTYTENGYTNRQDYLKSLADEREWDLQTLLLMAQLLGPSEDFDGLITLMEDQFS